MPVALYVFFTAGVIFMMVGLPFIPLELRLYVMELPVTILVSCICLNNLSLPHSVISIFERIGKRSTTIFIVHFVPILFFRNLKNIPYVLEIIICVVSIIIFTEMYEYTKRHSKEKRMSKNA